MRERLVLRQVVFAALLFPLLGPFRWVLTVAALALSSARPAWRWPILMTVSVLMWFDRFGFVPFTFVPGSRYTLSVLGLAATLGTGYLLAYLCLLVVNRVRFAFIFPFCIYLAILALSEYAEQWPEIFRYAKVLDMIFVGMIWPLAITALAPKIFTRFSRLQTAALLLPYWQSFVVLPIPIGPSMLMNYEAQEQSALNETQKKGLQLLLWSLAIAGLAGAFEAWAFGWTFQFRESFQDLSRYYSSGYFTIFTAIHGSSRLASFGAVLAILLRFFLALAWQTGVSIAVARMMGFNLPKMVDRPFAATSFSNLYGRLLYYNNQLLMKTWFQFFWRLFPKNTPERAKLATGVLLSVWIGGFVFHFFRDLSVAVGRVPLVQFAGFYLNLMPYYFLIALSSALSALSLRRPHRGWRFFQPLFVLVYFSVYSAIYSLNNFVNYDLKTWAQVKDVWLGVIGL